MNVTKSVFSKLSVGGALALSIPAMAVPAHATEIRSADAAVDFSASIEQPVGVSSAPLSQSALDRAAFSTAVVRERAGEIVLYDSPISPRPLAADPAAAPEAATWAMMILGLGFAGASLRRSNQNVRVTFA